jgi:hypothetical protein
VKDGTIEHANLGPEQQIIKGAAEVSVCVIGFSERIPKFKIPFRREPNKLIFCIQTIGFGWEIGGLWLKTLPIHDVLHGSCPAALECSYVPANSTKIANSAEKIIIQCKH